MLTQGHVNTTLDILLAFINNKLGVSNIELVSKNNL